MEIVEVAPGVRFVWQVAGSGNLGLVQMDDGWTVIDTTGSPGDMLSVLRQAGLGTWEVSHAVLTHFHHDHTWGAQVFECPVTAQRLCAETMVGLHEGEWSGQSLRDLIDERRKTDPDTARALQEKYGGLRIRIPEDTFEERHFVGRGPNRMDLIHLGGHTPDLTIAWLPGPWVFFASDLLFIGRYPYLFDAVFPRLEPALTALLDFDTAVIVPGHGPLCAAAEIRSMLAYLRETRERAEWNRSQGHSEDETAHDPGFPRYAEGPPKLHEANIRLFYKNV